MSVDNTNGFYSIFPIRLINNINYHFDFFLTIFAGVVLVASGFDAALEYEQLPSTILKLRILFSLVPACILLSALLLLIRYPLTRARVMEIKDELHLRHEAEKAKEKPATA